MNGISLRNNINHLYVSNHSKTTTLSHLDSTANNQSESPLSSYDSCTLVLSNGVCDTYKTNKFTFDTYCVSETVEREYFTVDNSSRMTIKQFIPIAVPKHKFSKQI